MLKSKTISGLSRSPCNLVFKSGSRKRPSSSSLRWEQQTGRYTRPTGLAPLAAATNPTRLQQPGALLGFDYLGAIFTLGLIGRQASQLRRSATLHFALRVGTLPIPTASSGSL